MRLLNNVATTPAARTQFTERQLADALKDFMAGGPPQTLVYEGDRCAGIYDVGDAGILAIVVEGHLLTICTFEDAFRAYPLQAAQRSGTETRTAIRSWGRDAKPRAFLVSGGWRVTERIIAIALLLR